MNWIDTNTLITICTGAIGLTQFILWKHIAKVKAYEAEKGKNLATKEDIGDITNEIKSVENKFINETEKLKCSLSILANIQTDIASMERNSIIPIIPTPGPKMRHNLFPLPVVAVPRLFIMREQVLISWIASNRESGDWK